MSPMADFLQPNLVGRSPLFIAALELTRKYSASDATVLIVGETGTGKELAARSLHYTGRRKSCPFVPVNCGAIPENLIESEIFGHVRGAFTDARESQLGLIAQAGGGTLFLDEVEAMSPRTQVALLRFLQDHQYRPVGGKTNCSADVRIVAAANVDLGSLVKQGAFRPDLLYRLNVLPLHLPALRDRGGDIQLLAQSFLERLNQRQKSLPKILTEESIAQLNSHSWPGNVRELENLIERGYVLAGDRSEIRFDSLGIGTSSAPGAAPIASVDEGYKLAKARAIAEFEHSYFTSLLSRTSGNLSLAARLAGKDRSDIGKLLRKHGIERTLFSGGVQVGEFPPTE